MEPKDLLKEIVSGRVPVSVLDRVTERLPAEMLQEAVDFLTKNDSNKCASEGESPSVTSITSTLTGASGAVQSADSITTAVGQSALGISKPDNSGARDSGSGDGKTGAQKRKLEGFDASKVNC
jgi:hypothetical protein